MGIGMTQTKEPLPILPAYVAAGAGFVILIALWAAFLMPATIGGRASFVIVNGGSMEPALRDGDLTLLRRQANYAPGQIVAFRAGGGVAVHRIQSVQPDGTYVMKGDNKERIDPWLPSDENVLGKVMLRVPLVGRVIQNGGPLVFGLLVGLLVTLAAFWQDPAEGGAKGVDRPDSPTNPIPQRLPATVRRAKRKKAA
jgi:signal peptidase